VPSVLKAIFLVDNGERLCDVWIALPISNDVNVLLSFYPYLYPVKPLLAPTYLTILVPSVIPETFRDIVGLPVRCKV